MYPDLISSFGAYLNTNKVSSSNTKLVKLSLNLFKIIRLKFTFFHIKLLYQLISHHGLSRLARSLAERYVSLFWAEGFFCCISLWCLIEQSESCAAFHIFLSQKTELGPVCCWKGCCKWLSPFQHKIVSTL